MKSENIISVEIDLTEDHSYVVATLDWWTGIVNTFDLIGAEWPEGSEERTTWIEIRDGIMAQVEENNPVLKEGEWKEWEEWLEDDEPDED